jgi:hypothetical protein
MGSLLLLSLRTRLRTDVVRPPARRERENLMPP